MNKPTKVLKKVSKKKKGFFSLNFSFLKNKKKNSISKNNKKEAEQDALESRKEVPKNTERKKVNFPASLSSHEKELFVKRMSYLLKAGVPILQSLAMIKDQSRSKSQKKIIESLSESVANGQTINASLGRFKKVFGDFIINVIRVGEETGLLHQNLNYLAEELKKRRILRRKVISAFIYPAFIALATIGITTLLIIFIFPKILPIFKSMNVTLPLVTRILIWLTNFLAHYGFYVLLILVLLIVISVLISKLSKVRFLIDSATPLIPIIGKVLQNYHLANITRTLGTLLRSDMALIEAIKVTAETTPNLAYKKTLEKMGESILKGKKISAQFESFPRFFPILIPQMISVGETTGNLSGSLLYLAEFYEEEVDETTKNLSNILEPILMIFMGVIVGSVVISIIMPIYGVTQHLNIR
jgi:type IV pilus assembly protein PilC